MSENTSTQTLDDVNANDSNGQSEQALLDAVMANSPLMNEVAPPLPTKEEEVVDPVPTSEEVDPIEEEIVSEEVEEVNETEEEVESEDAVEETATEEPTAFAAEDLDLDAKVIAKIDGEEAEVSFGDLIKGYQTDAHLSKKGRELSEAQKAFDGEKEAAINEIKGMAQASASVLYQSEQALSKEYHDIQAKIEKARKDGDTFELGELKDKKDQIQENYWKARNQRETVLKQVQEHEAKVAQKQWEDQLSYFQQEIPNFIPEFNEKMASDIRQFAIDEGLKPEILNQITDPAIVKFVNDYRVLKQGVSKGTAKRKVVPAKKALPTKKPTSPQKKAEDKAKMVKARAFKENATVDDQMAFLRQHASKSLNL